MTVNVLPTVGSCCSWTNSLARQAAQGFHVAKERAVGILQKGILQAQQAVTNWAGQPGILQDHARRQLKDIRCVLANKAKPVKAIPHHLFLQPDNGEHNLSLFARASPYNAFSLATEGTWSTVPGDSYVALGFGDRASLQHAHVAGCSAKIALWTTATVLAVLAKELVGCVAKGTSQTIDSDITWCLKDADGLWSSPERKILMVALGSLALFAAYLHRDGLLAPLLHDRSHFWRVEQLDGVYRSTADHLLDQWNLAVEKKDSEKQRQLKRIAGAILRRQRLINSQLQTKLQLDKDEAEHLCQRIFGACSAVMSKPTIANPPTM